MSTVFSDFDACIKRYKTTAFNCLAPALDDAQITAKLSGFTEVNPDIKRMFGWHNGMVNKDGMMLKDLSLFELHWLYSLDEAIQSYQDECCSEWGIGEAFFPLFNNGESSLFLKLNASDRLVYYYNTGITDVPESIYDSVDRMMQTVMKLYEHDGYTLDDGMYKRNPEVMKRIGREMNPDADYWL